jgi:hypothetical protein
MFPPAGQRCGSVFEAQQARGRGLSETEISDMEGSGVWNDPALLEVTGQVWENRPWDAKGDRP